MVVDREREVLRGRGLLRLDDGSDEVAVRYTLRIFDTIDRTQMADGSVREGVTGESYRVTIVQDLTPPWLARHGTMVALVIDDGQAHLPCFVRKFDPNDETVALVPRGGLIRPGE